MRISVELSQKHAEILLKLLRRIGPRELEELLDDASEAELRCA